MNLCLNLSFFEITGEEPHVRTSFKEAYGHEVYVNRSFVVSGSDKLTDREVFGGIRIYNYTGRSLWIKDYNGRVYHRGCRPLVKHHEEYRGKLVVQEFYKPENDEYHVQGVFEHMIEPPYDEYDVYASEMPRSRTATIAVMDRVYSLEDIERTTGTGGYVLYRTPLMAFTTRNEAVEVEHFLKNPTRYLGNIGSTGVELIASFSTKDYRHLYANIGGAVHKLTPMEHPDGFPNTIRIRRVDPVLEKEITRSVSLDDLMTGGGVDGIRVYDNLQDAENDIRRPLSRQTERKHEEEIKALSEEFASKKVAVLDQYRETEKRQQLMLQKQRDRHAEEMSDLRLSAKRAIDKAKELKAEKLAENSEEENRAIRSLKRVRELHKEEKEKAVIEQRWSKATDRTSSWTMFVKAFAATVTLIGAIVGIVAMFL